MNTHIEPLGECQVRFANIDKKLDEIIKMGERIGRLEQWRNFIMGALFMLGVFMIPVITATIDKAVTPVKGDTIVEKLHKENTPDAPEN